VVYKVENVTLVKKKLDTFLRILVSFGVKNWRKGCQYFGLLKNEEV